MQPRSSGSATGRASSSRSHASSSAAFAASSSSSPHSSSHDLQTASDAVTERRMKRKSASTSASTFDKSSSSSLSPPSLGFPEHDCQVISAEEVNTRLSSPGYPVAPPNLTLTAPLPHRPCLISSLCSSSLRSQEPLSTCCRRCTTPPLTTLHSRHRKHVVVLFPPGHSLHLCLKAGRRPAPRVSIAQRFQPHDSR